MAILLLAIALLVCQAALAPHAWADGVDPLDTALQQVTAEKAKVKALGIAIIGIGVIVSVICGAWHLLIERSRNAIVMTVVGLVVATIGIAIISSQ
jgi:glucose uptake protein GlcU